MDYITEENRIYAKDKTGKVVAEITFPPVKDGIVNIDSTFVDESLRGQGVAGKLIKLVVDELEKSGRKAICTCSYAVTWFEKHPEFSHLLAQ